MALRGNTQAPESIEVVSSSDGLLVTTTFDGHGAQVVYEYFGEFAIDAALIQNSLGFCMESVIQFGGKIPTAVGAGDGYLPFRI